MADSIPHVLVLGGGSAGYTTVLHLQKHASTVPMRITLVDVWTQPPPIYGQLSGGPTSVLAEFPVPE